MREFKRHLRNLFKTNMHLRIFTDKQDHIDIGYDAGFGEWYMNTMYDGILTKKTEEEIVDAAETYITKHNIVVNSIKIMRIPCHIEDANYIDYEFLLDMLEYDLEEDGIIK